MNLKPGYKESHPGSPDMMNVAKNILGDTERLIQHLTEQGVQLPSYSRDSVDRPETNEYLTLQTRLIGNLEALKYLVQGPKKAMRAMLLLGEDLAALQIAFQFDFFNRVPRHEAVSIPDLALSVGIDEDRLARFMRTLVTHRIFSENTTGWFSHTPSSVLFHGDEDLLCTGQYLLDEFFKAATESADCVKQTPFQSNAKHSPFTMRHQLPLYQFYESNPDLAKRFAKALAGWTKCMILRLLGHLDADSVISSGPSSRPKRRISLGTVVWDCLGCWRRQRACFHSVSEGIPETQFHCTRSPPSNASGS
ncbi:putative sterigmatocystin 8-O-methyltransferase [Rosellinia necatrix]|uniref:Putative sterigmatocystin 8-O-methyltransferase n=1 Tax=Rosellinia necatrix TaxID=77044 RepID=A0A1W2TCZ3_ROSNE|nr:putative sterigmatocystin 8-O-methyltransferase [Rosellinia necatrix]